MILLGLGDVMRLLIFASAALALAGCAKPPVYLLADGRAPGADPVLNQQFEMDRMVCQGQMQKANVSGVTFTAAAWRAPWPRPGAATSWSGRSGLYG
jgi:hypothetical protein